MSLFNNEVLTEFEKEFIKEFEKTFIRDDNGRFDLTNIVEWWNRYGDMICSFEHIKKYTPPPFTEDNNKNHDIVHSIYGIGSGYYNIIKSIEEE